MFWNFSLWCLCKARAQQSRDYHMTTHLVYTHQWCRSKRPSEVKVGPWVVGGTGFTCSAEGVVQKKQNED